MTEIEKARNNEPRNFLEEYSFFIKPKIQDLDLFVKCQEGEFVVRDVSSALELSVDEVLHIMEKQAINSINTYTFFVIMEQGSSPICKLFHRELLVGATKYYNANDIAFIYDMDIEVVEEAFESLGLEEIRADYLDTLFEALPPSCADIYK